MGGYLLWYHWFIVRTGLVLGRGQAAFLVVITGIVMRCSRPGRFCWTMLLPARWDLPQISKKERPLFEKSGAKTS